MFSRNRHLAPLALLLTLGVAACGSDAATAPSATPTAGVASVTPTQNLAAGCPFTATQLDALLLAALPNGLEDAATSRFDNIEKTYDDFKLAPAQDKARELVLWIEKKYDEGKFSSGKTEAAQLQLLQIKTAILCLVGLPYPTSIDVGTRTIGFAYPGVPVTIARGDHRAGATFPAGAVNVPTQIVIEPRSQPLPTDLTQYPSFFQFTATPNVAFNTPVTVGVCLEGVPPEGTDIRLARGTGPDVGDIEILPGVTETALAFLECGDDALLGPAVPADPIPHPQISALDRASFFLARVTPRITGALADVLLPAPAHASALLRCCTLGGAAGSFSPFGGVDINSAKIEAITPTTVTGAAGSAATVTVKLTNKSNGRALRGEDVTFAVTGGGSVSPASAQTTQLPADGLATASWTLGAGTTSLSARGFIGRVPLGTSASSRVEIPGSPIVFSGTGSTATTFGFGASGWTVNTYASFSETIVGALLATPASGVLANAGFSNSSSNAVCPLYTSSAIKSPSAFPLNGYVAIRRQFIAPAGAGTAGLRISIDNDFRVFLNGQEITAGVTGLRNGGTGTFTPQSQVAGWFLHDGCPGGTTTPTGDFLVPLSGLNAVSNELLIIGRDRGEQAFLDAAIVP